MRVLSTMKLLGVATTGLTAARRFTGAKLQAYADPSARAAAKEAAGATARRAAAEAGRQMDRMRVVVQEKVVPFATTTLDNAMTVSEPARLEVIRRGKLAAAALRGANGAVVVKKRRRWPVAVAFLGLGGAIGAAAAWLGQAGKPVEITPYPTQTDAASNTSDTADDTAGADAHQPD